MKLDSVNSSQTEPKTESTAQVARKLRTKQDAAEEMARAAKQFPSDNSMAAQQANHTKEMLYSGVLSKLRSGQELSGYELSELRKRDPAMYAKALRGQRARQELRARLQKAKTSRDIELARQAMGLLAANAVLGSGMPAPAAPVGGASEGGQVASSGWAYEGAAPPDAHGGNIEISTGAASVYSGQAAAAAAVGKVGEAGEGAPVGNAVENGQAAPAILADVSVDAAPGGIPEGEAENGYAIAHRALRDEFSQFARKRERIALAELAEKHRAGRARQRKETEIITGINPGASPGPVRLWRTIPPQGAGYYTLLLLRNKQR